MRLRRCFAVPALFLLVASGTACVHLLQPETYQAPERSLRLQTEYLENELVRGLSEDAFRRFYTRSADWTDPGRPSIQETRAEDGTTVYRVGLGSAHAGDVVFLDGRLDHWVGSSLEQESVVSIWRHPRLLPHEVGADTLARLENLDPGREPFADTEALDAASAAACETGAGTVLELVEPRTFDPARRNRIDDIAWPESSRPADRGVLPAGTMLTIEPWSPVHDRRVKDDRGVYYELSPTSGLQPLRAGACPPGLCAHVGSNAILTRDLVLAMDEAGREARAIPTGRTRVPLWWRREPLPAGTRVQLQAWEPCGRAAAALRLPDRPDSPTRIDVPWAPPGLFRPI
jgi:hypothetical protein